MRFIVGRTSLYRDEKPCEEAFQGSCIRIDERTIDSPEKFPRPKDRETWYQEGMNHRVENGHIKRDFSMQEWFIKLDTLETLIDFVERYGDIIIKPWYSNPNEYSIEIYDDYRE